MKFKQVIFLVIWCVPHLLTAQSDSLQLLNIDDYLEVVRNHHPIAKQTDLVILKGDAGIIKAKGGFDPKLFVDYAGKDFDDKNYYNLFDAGLKLPTNLGVEFTTGFESNSGVFLNPENNVPSNGLWYAGISVSLGKGLLIDERRATLRKAKLYLESTEFERQILFNELIYDAGRSYWDWFMHFHTVEVFREAERVAIQRFDAVKQSAVAGESAAIDTLEAGIQVQNRTLALRQAEINYQKSKAMLSAYLWAEGVIPLEIEDNIIPMALEGIIVEAMDTTSLQNINALILNHPKLKFYEYKIAGLEIDQRLQRELLKPEIDVSLKALSTPINGSIINDYDVGNYALGINFNFPLFLRKERGDVELMKLKQTGVEYDLQNNQAQLLAKAIGALNEWTITSDQITIYNKTVNDYQLLFEGEQRLFQEGESSLFMVNSRESGYINARVKSIEIKAKGLKAKLAAEYTFGTLN